MTDLTATIHGFPLPPLKQLAYWQEITSILFEVRYNLLRHIDDDADPITVIQERLNVLFEELPEDVV